MGQAKYFIYNALSLVIFHVVTILITLATDDIKKLV